MTEPSEDVAALTYEEALAQLDALIARLERGDIPLDEAITAYERGSLLATHCSALLDRTEQRVTQLVVGGDGSLRERSLDPAPEPALQKPERRRVDPGEIPF